MMEDVRQRHLQLPKIIAISGKYGVGKDTAIDIITKEVEDNISVEHHKFANTLKHLTAELSNTSVDDNFSEKGKAKMIPDPVCTFEQFIAKLNVVIIKHIPHKISYGYKTKLVTIAKKIVKSDPNHPGMVTFGYTIGRLQQVVGTVFREDIVYDLWIAIVMESIQRDDELATIADNDTLKSNPRKIHIISDCRFKNEANEVKRRGGMVIRLNRKVDVQDGRDPTHISECDLDDYQEFDAIIDNDGTLEELRQKLKETLRLVVFDDGVKLLF